MTTFWVVSTRTDTRVVLWERDPAHPGGEVVIAGPDPVEVGDTLGVALALRRGDLIRTLPADTDPPITIDPADGVDDTEATAAGKALARRSRAKVAPTTEED